MQAIWWFLISAPVPLCPSRNFYFLYNLDQIWCASHLIMGKNYGAMVAQYHRCTVAGPLIMSVFLCQLLKCFLRHFHFLYNLEQIWCAPVNSIERTFYSRTSVYQFLPCGKIFFSNTICWMFQELIIWLRFCCLHFIFIYGAFSRNRFRTWQRKSPHSKMVERSGSQISQLRIVFTSYQFWLAWVSW